MFTTKLFKICYLIGSVQKLPHVKAIMLMQIKVKLSQRIAYYVLKTGNITMIIIVVLFCGFIIARDLHPTVLREACVCLYYIKLTC